MRGAGLIAAALFCAMHFGTAGKAAEPAPTETKTDAGDDLATVAVTTRDCGKEVPVSGPGSAAEPIEVDLDELEFVEDFDCKWVSSKATLRWTTYWHYRADAYADLAELYFRRYGRAYRLLVESFADPATTMTGLQHADVAFVALFADLCGQTESLPDSVFVYGGPCHYGPAGLLKEFRVAKVLAPPLRRLVGEANRDILGRLSRAPKNWANALAVRAAFVAWVGEVMKGPARYQEFLSRGDAELDDEARARLTDPAAWHSFISGANSPLRALRAPERAWKIEYFSSGEPPEDWSEVDYVDACVCLVDRCDDRWPLTPQDVDLMWGDYICAAAEDGEGGWTVVY